jgi:hypothetical protein
VIFQGWENPLASMTYLKKLFRLNAIACACGSCDANGNYVDWTPKDTIKCLEEKKIQIVILFTKEEKLSVVASHLSRKKDVHIILVNHLAFVEPFDQYQPEIVDFLQGKVSPLHYNEGSLSFKQNPLDNSDVQKCLSDVSLDSKHGIPDGIFQAYWQLIQRCMLQGAGECPKEVSKRNFICKCPENERIDESVVKMTMVTIIM